MRPLAPRRPGVQRAQRDIRRALVNEHEAVRLRSSCDRRPPSRSQELVAFARTHPSFFRVQPIRLSIRLTVDSVPPTPSPRLKNWRLWGSVAAGCSCRAASKSLLALSSSLGLEPGRFFGARDRPDLATAT